MGQFWCGEQNHSFYWPLQAECSGLYWQYFFHILFGHGEFLKQDDLDNIFYFFIFILNNYEVLNIILKIKDDIVNNLVKVILKYIVFIDNNSEVMKVILNAMSSEYRVKLLTNWHWKCIALVMSTKDQQYWRYCIARQYWRASVELLLLIL